MEVWGTGGIYPSRRLEGGATRHEALALAVAQDATLTAGALGDEAARAIDARRMELHELQVLCGRGKSDEP